MRWVIWAVLTFAMHFIWEMFQAQWFASMAGLRFWTATVLCFRATLGDLVITALAFGAAAAAERRPLWPLTHRLLPFAVYLAMGLIITIAFEMFALKTGRWRYAADMPAVVGIGILPLIQWSAIPPLGIVFFRRLFRGLQTERTDGEHRRP